jgi:hypothetical protein
MLTAAFLHWDGAVDLTAVGTVLLALATFVSVQIGRRALRGGQREIELSRREVEEAHRPVVMPLIAYRGANPVLGPHQAKQGHIIVPIENIGSGPALDIEVVVTPRDDEGNQSEAWGDRKYVGKLPGLGAGASKEVNVEIEGLGDLPSLDVWITYSDVAQKEWVTVARWSRPHDGYDDLSVNTLKEGAHGLRLRNPIEPVRQPSWLPWSC